MYFVIHSSQLIVIHSLSRNESLCTGIKAKGPISFTSVESVADNHQFKTIHQLYKKKFFHKTTFLPAFAFFHGNLSRGNNIKNNQTSLCWLSNLLLIIIKFSSFRKTNIRKFHIRKLKILFSTLIGYRKQLYILFELLSSA